MKKLFEVNSGGVVVTPDFWTTSNQEKGYVAVTLYFVDDD